MAGFSRKVDRPFRIFLFFAARIRFCALRFLAVYQKKEGSERPKGSPEPCSVRKRRLRRRLKRRGRVSSCRKNFFKKFFQNIKPFSKLTCLSRVSEVRFTKSRNIMQWFVCLFRKGMDEYTENKQQKEKIFRIIKERQKSEGEGRTWTTDRQ